MLDGASLARAAASEEPLIVALSGGGDSTALLHLLHEALGPARLRAIVVDHGLRAGSAEDARRAREIAAGLGVEAEIETLAWDAGEGRGQSHARTKRYAALCAAARRLGGSMIALGHTADDQAETVLLRARAGSHWRGLAGIAADAPAPLWPEGRGLRVVRPLLGARRSRLRAELRARGADWIEDPANENPAFERVRVRKRLAELETGGFDPLRLVEIAAQLRALVRAIDREARRLIDMSVRFEAGDALLALDAWRGGEESRRRALSAVLVAISGGPREPEAGAVARLEQRLTGAGFRGASLGGARLERRGDLIMVSRDPGALFGRAGSQLPMAEQALPCGEDAVWDGRLLVRAARRGLRLRAGLPPTLVVDDEQWRLDQAVAAGLAAARWLTGERIDHVLGSR